MKLSTFFWGLFGLGRAGAQVHLPFVRQSSPPPQAIAGSGARRDAAIARLHGDMYTYMVKVTVGTPAQNLSLMLSPSSSDSWVPSGDSYACRSSRSSQRCSNGRFMANESETFVASSKYFDVSYTDGTYASGDYFADVLNIGGVQVKNLTMGLADGANQWIGVLGIGYNGTYDNLPDNMYNQGLINTTAYSMWVDDATAATGNLLFGAVDTAKYEGDLVRLSAYSSTASYGTFGVEVYGITGTNATVTDHNITAVDSSYASSSSIYPIPVAVSPPDSVSNLPTHFASQIWALANATFNYDRALIRCSANTSSLNLKFTLGGANGPVIDVPIADLVVDKEEPFYRSYSDYYYNSTDEKGWCLFGIQNGSVYSLGSGGGGGSSTSSSSSYYSQAWNLGSTVLRRTYTVFDVANHEVAVAPVKFGATDSAVVPFPSYEAYAPGARKYCSWASSGYCGEDGGYPGDRGEYVGGRVPSIAVVGIGIGAGLLLVAVAGGVTLCMTKRGMCGGAKRNEDAEKHVADHMAQTKAAGGEKSAPVMAMVPAATPMFMPVPPAPAPAHLPPSNGERATTAVPEGGPATSTSPAPATVSPAPEGRDVSPVSSRRSSIAVAR